MATPPRCVAGSVDRPPPSLPIGVRALLRITVRGMQPSLLSAPDASHSDHGRPARHRRRHDRRRGLRGRGDRARPRRRAAGAGGLRRGQARAAQARRDARRAGGATSSPGSARASEFDPERARVAAAAVARAREGARHADAVLGGAAPRLRRARGRAGRGHAARRLHVPRVQERRRRRRRLDGADRSPPTTTSAPPASRRRLVAEAVNAARDLQNAPANELTPTALAERARASSTGVSVEVLDRRGDRGGGDGRVRGVARGSHEEPRLITIRYEPADVAGPLLGLRRQGGDVRLRRHLDQARGEDARDEVRHVGRRRRAGGRRRDRRAASCPVRVAGVIGATENLPVRPRGQARRHRARQDRRDDRGQQHRRRGPARAGRLPRARDRPRRRAARRPGDADRRDRRRARPHLRGPVRQRRRLGGRDHRAPASAPASSSGGMPLHDDYAKRSKAATPTSSTRPPTAAAGSHRRRRVPPPLRRRRPVGAPRHRRRAPTTTASPTRPRAAPAGASACWSSSPRANRRPRPPLETSPKVALTPLDKGVRAL